MNDPSEGTLVLELAYLLGELSHRNTELLASLRSLRAKLNREDVPAAEPRTFEVSVEPQPGTARLSDASIVSVFRRSSGQERPEPSASDSSQFTEHSLKRDYDYFAELDTTLSRLQPLAPNEAGGAPPGSDTEGGEAPTPTVKRGPKGEGADPSIS